MKDVRVAEIVGVEVLIGPLRRHLRDGGMRVGDLLVLDSVCRPKCECKSAYHGEFCAENGV